MTTDVLAAARERIRRRVHQHCSDKHLQCYLNEFDFRYSNRIAVGLNDADRAAKALEGVAGKRLTY